MSKLRNQVAILVVLLLSFVSLSLVLAQPEAPGTLTDNGQERRGTNSSLGYTYGNVFAGNITSLTVEGVSITQGWAGFYGNITGAITLDDIENRTLYNWSLSNPEGEVYATTSTLVNWSGNETGGQGGTGNLRCWSTTEAVAENTNITELEDTFSMVSDDVDGIDETFNSGTHDPFFVGSVNFTDNSCLATSTYTAMEVQNTALFQEVILYDDTNNAVIWATIIEPNVTSGFTGGDTDFQMIIPEDGNGTDVAPTTYYFFVELE